MTTAKRRGYTNPLATIIAILAYLALYALFAWLSERFSVAVMIVGLIAVLAAAEAMAWSA